MPTIMENIYLFIKDAIGSVNERVRHPIFIVFLISWPFFNWSFLYDVLVSDMLTKELITEELVGKKWGDALFYPLLWAFFISLFYAPLKEVSETCSTFFQNIVIKIRSTVLPASVVCASKHDGAMRRLEESIRKNKDLSVVNAGTINDLEEEKKALQHQLDRSNISISEVSGAKEKLEVDLAGALDTSSQLLAGLNELQSDFKEAKRSKELAEEEARKLAKKTQQLLRDVGNLRSQLDATEQSVNFLSGKKSEMESVISKIRKLSKDNEDIAFQFDSSSNSTAEYIRKLDYIAHRYKNFIVDINDTLGNTVKNVSPNEHLNNK